VTEVPRKVLIIEITVSLILAVLFILWTLWLGREQNPEEQPQQTIEASPPPAPSPTPTVHNIAPLQPLPPVPQGCISTGCQAASIIGCGDIYQDNCGNDCGRGSRCPENKSCVNLPKGS